jgi:hypothetical protein
MNNYFVNYMNSSNSEKSISEWAWFVLLQGRIIISVATAEMSSISQ